MKRCHYVTDKQAGRVLIPGCWSVVMSNDINDCICPKNEKTLEERVERVAQITNKLSKDDKG